MLTLVSGPFHPSLEDAFIERIKELKKDPWSPVAVVAPSTKIRERCELILGRANLAFLNIHFHTFSSLATHVVESGGGLPKPLLSDPLFFDTLVKRIVKEDRPFSGWEGLDVPEGFPPQVRGTLRDLMDAGIPADGPVLLEAVKDDFLGRDVDVGWLLQLLRLYQIYGEHLEKLPVAPTSTLLKWATEKAKTSLFLKNFEEIIYYGFYDLTGLQKEFFEAVCREYPVRLYFPYEEGNPAYEFSRRFREDFLVPIKESEIQLAAKTDGNDVELKIVNTSGVRDEAGWVATEILRLHEEEKIPFSSIAVVTRSQERLGPLWEEIFNASHIPFHSAVEESLTSSPLVGELLKFLEGASLPKSSTWSEFAVQTQALLETTFFSGHLEAQDLQDILLIGLDKMKTFDLLGSKVSTAEFLDTLKERWLQARIPGEAQSCAGVSLLYAEAARGLAFEAIFLVGIEERVFPRIIREDPFLRDDARFALFNTLGYKISPKLAAFDEEKLLFEILTNAAQKKLFLTYQRTDEEGRVVGPSPFLRRFVEEQKLDFEKDVSSIPRSLLAKVRIPDPTYLPERDILFGYLTGGHTAEGIQFADLTSGQGKWLKTQLEVLAAHERLGEPGPFDGCVPKQKWDDLFNKGRGSATALETFGRCPFQFFASSLLKLEPLDDKEVGTLLAKDEQGKLIHSFFETFFKQLDPTLLENPKAAFPSTYFEKTFQTIFDPIKPQEMRVHPLLWEANKVVLKQYLREFLERDLQDLRDTGFRPAHFETEMAGTLTAPLNQLPWVGKPDRIDVKGDTIRILDYKTGRITENPLKDSLKGLKAQPALYALLAEAFFQKKGQKINQILFEYRRLGAVEDSSALTSEEWTTNKDAILATLHTELELMSKGQFLISPHEDYCGWCDYQEICRKNHGPTLTRSKKGSGKILAELRAKKIGENS